MYFRLMLFLLFVFPAFSYAQARIEPPEEKLGSYVVDSGAGLDTGCSYRGSGPLMINVPVPIVVNPEEIDGQGYLKDAQKLIGNKVIGRTARIFFPAYDVDDKAVLEEPYQPEVDLITFNGNTYGKNTQEGLNNTWIMQSIEVPITDIKFGNGNKNLLRIDIDTANVPYGEIWCTAVDWVGVEFDVAAPYVLAHGIASDATTWDAAHGPDVQDYLNDLGIRWTRFSAEPNGSTAGNARLLHDQLVPWLDELRSDRFHVIAHSKGGLDYQMMEYMYGDRDFKILSLSTLSTPHLGSVAADLNILERRKMDSYNAIAIESPDPGGWVNAYLNNVWLLTQSGIGPELPGLYDLETQRSANYVGLGMRGNIAHTYTIGANADLNGNGELECEEAEFMAFHPVRCLFENVWQTLRRHSNAGMVRVDTNVLGWTTLVIETVPTQGLQDNDAAVTVASANPYYGTPVRNDMANHTAVKNRRNVQALVERTIEIRE